MGKKVNKRNRNKRIERIEGRQNSRHVKTILQLYLYLHLGTDTHTGTHTGTHTHIYTYHDQYHHEQSVYHHNLNILLLQALFGDG